MTKEAYRKIEEGLKEAIEYLKDGGLYETWELANAAKSMGQPKVQMDTDMALALIEMAQGAHK